MGAGLDMDVGDIAFKCNFACLNRSSGIVESRRADRRLLLHHTTSPEVSAGVGLIRLLHHPRRFIALSKLV
jgi:hypothetical protein